VNSQYSNLRKLAQDLEFKLRDKLDDKSDPVAKRLTAEFQGFLGDVESEKSARTLEDRAKNVKDLLKAATDSGDKVMDYQDADFFEDKFEDIIRDLRGFDNY
jgi:hypothetical protein